MNLYLDFISIKGFNFEKFKLMAYSFKEIHLNALFKSQNLWFDCSTNEQDDLMNYTKDYFSKYTLFPALEIVKEKEGFWVTPVMDDFQVGGKGAYLEDLFIAQYALGLQNINVSEAELKNILPYEHYFFVFFNEQIRESIGYWLVNKEDGYNKVRGLILKNSNTILTKQFPKHQSKDTLILKVGSQITKDGFPDINKEALLNDLKSNFKEREPKD